MRFKLPAERDKFIMNNIGLVKDSVLTLNKGVFDEDLFQVGLIGLIKATDGFDKDRGNEFSTYAKPCIDDHINKHKKYDSLIKPLVKEGWKFEYKNIASLDEPLEDGNLCLGDTISGNNNLEKSVIDEIFVDMFIKSLSEIEQKVIMLKLQGLSQKNISERTVKKEAYISIIVKRVRKKYLDCLARTM